MRFGPGIPAVLAVMAVAPLAQAGVDEESFTITGTSTVRGWSCEVPLHEERVSLDGPVETVLAGEAALNDMQIVVPVAAIECGNGKMNDHLRKALQADEHPEVVYQLSSYDLSRTEEGVTAVVDGTLSIAGEILPLPLTVTVASEDGAIRVTGEREITMTEWGVKPPSLFLGTMKVGERVTVAFDITLHS